MFSAQTYSGPILVTVIYIAIYYLMQVNQLRVKTRLAKEYQARGERFDRYFNTDRMMLAADRYVLNTLEHMGPFLSLLWLHAMFVGATTATIAGGAYAFSRAIYPFAMGKQLGRSVPSRIMLATVIGYVSVAYLGVSLAIKCF